jgi:hypothetical protein
LPTLRIESASPPGAARGLAALTRGGADDGMPRKKNISGGMP